MRFGCFWALWIETIRFIIAVDEGVGEATRFMARPSSENVVVEHFCQWDIMFKWDHRELHLAILLQCSEKYLSRDTYLQLQLAVRFKIISDHLISPVIVVITCSAVRF